MLSISSESSVEVPLQVDVHVIADGDLDLSNPPSGECEVGGVFLADRVSGVPTDAQPLAGQCKVRRLGAPGFLGNGLVVNMQRGGADRLIAGADALLGELDSKDMSAARDLF
jgi:hypothetical protein